MSEMSCNIDDYIQNLNKLPSVTSRLLQNIRNLDKQVLHLHNQIEPKREQALQKLFEFEYKPTPRLRHEIGELLRVISDLHHKMLALSQKKIKLSDEMYNCIDLPTESLNRELFGAIKAYPGVENSKTSKYKRIAKNNEQEFFASQPCYCYCNRPSFGLMVKCENEHCEVEWFHLNCLGEKTIPEKWWCRKCKKTRGKDKARVW